MSLPKPELEHVFDLAVTVSPPIDIGITPFGMRRVIPITGGTLTLSEALALRYYPGENGAHGHVLSAGADFQLILNAGTMANLDARYVLEMRDGSRVFVANTALRVASVETSARLMRGDTVESSEVYFRCQPRFETPAPQWSWLNDHQFVGSGMRKPDGVYLSFFKVL